MNGPDSLARLPSANGQIARPVPLAVIFLDLRS